MYQKSSNNKGTPCIMTKFDKKKTIRKKQHFPSFTIFSGLICFLLYPNRNKYHSFFVKFAQIIVLWLAVRHYVKLVENIKIRLVDPSYSGCIQTATNTILFFRKICTNNRFLASSETLCKIRENDIFFP